MSYRFHIVGLPHTMLTAEYAPCAYTQKVRNFARMMMSLGHEVYLYGGAECDVDVTEHITIVEPQLHQRWFGHNDWKKDFFDIEWSSSKEYWKIANNNAIAGIQRRIQERDFICLIGGICQKPIADVFSNNMTVEFGVGYNGVFSAFRVFESYAWMHHIYGIQGTNDGLAYDAVIPNFYDPKDFPLYVRSQKEDYYAYCGRLVRRKGIELAVETTRRIGAKLKLAGQGVVEYRPGYLKTQDAVYEGDHIEYVGVLGVKERGEFLGKAKAVFVPTTYIEPFGGIHVESWLCGTPVITSDWGVFTETVRDGETGYRVRALGEAVAATKQLGFLWGALHLRDYAKRRFSLDVVRHRYQDYFDQLMTLWEEGWYSMHHNGVVKRLHGGFV